MNGEPGPRSSRILDGFLYTKLKADFSAGSYAPLSDAPLYGDDLAKAEISDGVAGVVAASLTAAQVSDILSRLLRNASGAVSYAESTRSGLADPLHDRIDDRDALPEVRVRVHGGADLLLREQPRRLGVGEERVPQLDAVRTRFLREFAH